MVTLPVLAGLLVLNAMLVAFAWRHYSRMSASARLGVGEATLSDGTSGLPSASLSIEASPTQLTRSLPDDLITALRAGILAGEFVPWFEPQVDLGSGMLRGFEMLARWERPGRGVTMPDDFIPVAEEAGLIGDLSLSVMHQAMAEARGWDNDLILSVNISPVQIKDPWLAQKIAKLLAETNFPAERLEVEITEYALIENLGLAQAIVTSFKNQGIRLALDDFGTGYSSLAHLRALPFDRIKIDRSFVASLDRDADSAIVVTAITRLAESMNLSITAEGIENDAIAARLRAIGSYTGQGWLFGKPMRANEVRDALASRGLLPARRDGYSDSRMALRA